MILKIATHSDLKSNKLYICSKKTKVKMIFEYMLTCIAYFVSYGNN